jgi:hypothetical protein
VEIIDSGRQAALGDALIASHRGRGRTALTERMSRRTRGATPSSTPPSALLRGRYNRRGTIHRNHPSEAMMSAAPRPRLSFEDWLAMERGATDQPSEYVGGEVFAMAGRIEEHNLILLAALSLAEIYDKVELSR